MSSIRDATDYRYHFVACERKQKFPTFICFFLFLFSWCCWKRRKNTHVWFVNVFVSTKRMPHSFNTLCSLCITLAKNIEIFINLRGAVKIHALRLFIRMEPNNVKSTAHNCKNTFCFRNASIKIKQNKKITGKKTPTNWRKTTTFATKRVRNKKYKEKNQNVGNKFHYGKYTWLTAHKKSWNFLWLSPNADIYFLLFYYFNFLSCVTFSCNFGFGVSRTALDEEMRESFVHFLMFCRSSFDGDARARARKVFC